MSALPQKEDIGRVRWDVRVGSRRLRQICVAEPIL
jgi:hypothetical protein